MKTITQRNIERRGKIRENILLILPKIVTKATPRQNIPAVRLTTDCIVIN